VNTNGSSLVFILGMLIFAPSLFFIIKMSEGVDELVGFNYLTGHWWLLLITGITFCAIGFSHDNTQEGKLNEKLGRMSKDLKDLKLKINGVEDTSSEISRPQELITPESNLKPETGTVGTPDGNGFEWINSEDGKNWYRAHGSSDDWIEFSN